MTGCLRISKESIFTGLNNFTAYSVLNNISSESFGFTELEVKQLLKDYNLSEKMDEVKEWYDGYQFGNKEIYNPWSTLMYVKNITQDVSFKPISFGQILVEMILLLSIFKMGIKITQGV